MSNRDEFSEDTKRKVALRANHHCSFSGCPQITSGPSDESPEAVSMIGKAAHIHAAAPGRGARRYLASMTNEERKDITNAIWLCATHADLIDRDEVTYAADALRAMKNEHAENIRVIQRNGILAGVSMPDLIAIGPDIVFTGELLGIDNEEWSFHLHHFVDGDVHNLIAFIERYEKSAAIDRYVLVNFLGDGRALKGTPSMTKVKTGGYIVRCPVLPSADRIRAADLPEPLHYQTTMTSRLKTAPSPWCLAWRPCRSRSRHAYRTRREKTHSIETSERDLLNITDYFPAHRGLDVS